MSMNALPNADAPAGDDSNNRKEVRYTLQLHAILQRNTGESILGSTVNASGSGVLLEIALPPDLRLGERVCCSMELYAGKAPQEWGVGRIVRIEGSRVAIEFSGLDGE
jgi:PilZ domain